MSAKLDFAQVRSLFGGAMIQPQVDGINHVLSTFSVLGCVVRRRKKTGANQSPHSPLVGRSNIRRVNLL